MGKERQGLLPCLLHLADQTLPGSGHDLGVVGLRELIGDEAHDTVCDPAGMFQLLLIEQGVDLGFDDHDLAVGTGLLALTQLTMQARDFEIHVCSALASIRVRDDVRTLDTDADDRIHVKAYRSKPGDGELVVVVEGGTQRPRRMLFFGEHPWFASSSHAVNTVTPKRTNVVIARPLCSHRRGLVSGSRSHSGPDATDDVLGPVRTWEPCRSELGSPAGKMDSAPVHGGETGCVSGPTTVPRLTSACLR